MQAEEKMKKSLSRRVFCKNCLAGALGIVATPLLEPVSESRAEVNIRRKKADYWSALDGKRTKCLLCPNGCVTSPGENGRCRSRGNRDGIYYSLSYGRPCVIALDSIEKSPLYHFQIQGQAFSIATPGCNLACKYCHNWEYSQKGPLDVEKVFDLEPEEVVRRAQKHGVTTMNYFYTEPTIYYEYMMDIARLARRAGMKNVCVTAGYINEEPLRNLIPFIDAFVVGLKGFTEDYYNEYMNGPLEPVKRTLKILSENRKASLMKGSDGTAPWFEIVYLVVPGLNDKESEIDAMASWLHENIGQDVPLHFTRFSPAYQLKNLPPTPVGTLDQARKIAMKAGLEYVYEGNLPGSEGAHTYCPVCHKKVIERLGFTVIKNDLHKGRCQCGHTLPGNWG